MNTITLLALLLFGLSLAAPPSAVTITADGEYQWPDYIEVAKVTNRSRKKHNYSSSSVREYIPGYIPTPYGRGDCIGWWEPRGDGTFRCRGQFIPYRY